MSENETRLTRSGQRILDYLVQGDKRTRENEGRKVQQFTHETLNLRFNVAVYDAN